MSEKVNQVKEKDNRTSKKENSQTVEGIKFLTCERKDEKGKQVNS